MVARMVQRTIFLFPGHNGEEDENVVEDLLQKNF